MNNTDGRIWFGSDLHLEHHMLVETGQREKDYEKKFFTMWHNCVRDDDVVVLLGDIAFKRQAYWCEYIASLPGRKRLVLGNHDKNRVNWYQRKGFENVVAFGQSDMLKHWMGNILLTHIPADVAVLTSYDYRFKSIANQHAKEMDANSCILNIHGHTHNKATETHRTFDVGIESSGEKLLSLEQILDFKFRSYRDQRKRANSLPREQQDSLQQTIAATI